MQGGFEMNRKKLYTVILSIFLCAFLVLPAHAAIDPYAALMAKSQQAVDAAIRTGAVPPGTTIFECMFHTGEDGVLRIVEYQNENGDWIDVSTGDKEVYLPGTTIEQITDKTISRYRTEVFELVNAERENAGLAPVVWDDDFAACAQIRAEELSRKYSHERPDPVDEGTDWPQNTSGIGIYNAPSVADEQGVPHEWIMENIHSSRGRPVSVIRDWMESSGHRRNILKESHTRCGTGVYQASDGGLYWALWFDDYNE
jgi:uncharacterized protein YkwD